MAEPTLYELSVPGRRGVRLPDADVPKTPLPEALVRDDNGLPELSELDVARHFQRLSHRSFGVDSGFYPLGSCTMKYNPQNQRGNGSACRALPAAHPLQARRDGRAGQLWRSCTGLQDLAQGDRRFCRRHPCSHRCRRP